ALGAWGLGWEVWLDGQEISQYTYFQQAGGQELNPVSVELTYGLERIVMVLQGVRTFPEIAWRDAVTYGDLRLKGEIEHCTYNFQVANVDRLRQLHDLCEAEAKEALARGLVLPAHDYVLKCSHLFNVLDARGAIGVTERARYFVRMRDLSREVAALYVKQREELGHPLAGKVAAGTALPNSPLPAPAMPAGTGPWDLLLEIGSEELPVSDMDLVREQLRDKLAAALQAARLPCVDLAVRGTARRTVAQVRGLERQRDQERVVKGPPVRAAFDADGQPTKAAQGFARSQGLEVSALQQRTIDGKEYVVAVLQDVGREASAVLAELLPSVIASLSFPKSMRWNNSGVSFSRPLRWYVALLDDQEIPFEYAGVRSGRVSRGNRSLGAPDVRIASAADYERAMGQAGVMLDVQARERSIMEQVQALAREVGGEIPQDSDLLREVANLVEYPLAIRGGFEEEYLRLPEPVLLAVMRKHQRYFPVLRDGKMLPCFITVANGANLDQAAVRYGNEEVLRARYADAAFFFDADSKQPLASFTAKLASLTFQERLGSVLDKVHRIEALVAPLAERLGLSASEQATAERVAALCKSDLATQLVVEITSLQGIMGRVYAERGGEA
ncbi:MAG: glycine--tRNA ligase subunit beta, partial [Chloroflexi bacterium]|nr:glycine--tRNA ligase subunit beta [Chloroflexota bacterium]